MNGVPIIVSNEQLVLMLPMNHSLISTSNNLEENKSIFFIIQHSIIQVRCILSLDTKFSGKSCDRQNVLLNSNKSYGCFSLKSSRSNIISMHYICFSADTGEMNIISELRSLKFLEKFTKGNLSVDIRLSRLQSGNDAYNDIVDAFDEIVDLVNSEDGWTVYG